MENAPDIVAIVNVTDDSFSDGGRYRAPEAAIAHARALESQGADWIELGPASSNPDAGLVPADEQIRRLEPIVRVLGEGPLPLSIDATLPPVLDWALDAGVDMVNDVRGFPDPATRERLADARAKVVVVHSLLGLERATRDHATPEEVLDRIDRFFEARLAELVAAGVDERRLIVDPGMGFFLGDTPEPSVAVLQRLPELAARYALPLYVSVSRKSFLGALTGKPTADRGAATLAAELEAIDRGAACIRTHDVAALHDALAVRKAVRAE